MVEGPSSGLALLEGLELHHSHRLHAVRAHLHEETGDLAAAAQCHAAAAARTNHARERDYLVEQAARVSAR
jgi:predicted RNA polymerase sigma factor